MIDDENYDTWKENRQTAIKTFFIMDDPVIGGDRNNLANALYAVSEMGMWFDEIDNVSEEQAILCWKVVEKLRKEKFPQELRM